MAMNLMVGCVGKPSAGKSTFFNACTDCVAKIGNFPFTTIDPNEGVSYFPMPCPCARFGKQEQCSPRHGRCVNGTRFVPVRLLDVAGLVPGAAQGQGLGNKFLDDLRHAHVLIHVIDVSGNTNEKGEVTVGYDPINDIAWLHGEIHSWIFNNLWNKWSSIVRRHVATKSRADETLHAQFSGYGTQLSQVQEALDKINVKEPSGLEDWEERKVHELVDAYLEVRFPTVFLLNKVDSPEADKNIAKICKKYPNASLVLSSALGEVFLRKMRKSGYIKYTDGEDDFITAEQDGPNTTLKPLDAKMKEKLEKLRDMVLYRYGSTGVQQAVTTAVELRKPVMCFPVPSIHNFGRDGKAFRDCIMLKPGTTIRELAQLLSPELSKKFAYAEGVDGRRMGADEEITEDNNIIRIVSTHEEG